MRKILLLSFVLLIFSVSFAQNNQTITQFQSQARQAYINYANPLVHQQIKSQKVVTDYVIDDTRFFWRWDFSNMPPAWVYEEGICKAVGEESYVFVAVSQWNVNINQADIDEIMSFLEDSTLNTTDYGIVSMDTMLFGDIPDELDNDPKVIFYFTDLGSYNGSVFDGYFSSYNQMTEAEAQQDGSHSNECEMLYMSCDPVDPTDISTLSVLSHELQHLIHFGYDKNEETWLNEGCSELAMVAFGYPDPITSFNTNPNNNLTVWDQQWADYVQVQLFFTYLYENFDADFMKSVVQSTLLGVQSINVELTNYGFDTNFEEVFDNWTLANFINDTLVEDGQYGYTLLNLPNFSYTLKDTYPISIASSLNNSASRYYKIPPDYGQQFEFNFENPDHWNVNLLFYDNNDSLLSISPLDINSNYIVPEETWELGKLYFTLSNHFAGTGVDAYNVDITNNGANTNSLLQNEISVRYNNSNITLVVPFTENGVSIVNIYDLSGKIIYTENVSLNNDLNFINIPSNNFSSGIYLINVTSNQRKFTAKFVRL